MAPRITCVCVCCYATLIVSLLGIMHKPYSAVRRRNKVVVVYVNSETGSER
jgi:hypothetical protein